MGKCLSKRFILISLVAIGFFTSRCCLLSLTVIERFILYGDDDFNETFCPPYYSYMPSNHSWANVYLKNKVDWGLSSLTHLQRAHDTGFLLGVLPLGIAVDKLGAKTLFGLSVFFAGLCSVLTPLCTRLSVASVIAIRFILSLSVSFQGSAVAWLVARWCSSRRAGLVLAIIYSGYLLAYSTNFYLYVVLLPLNYRWSSLFYVVGGVAILWSCVWQGIAYDEPFFHPTITDEELRYLASTAPLYLNYSYLTVNNWPWSQMIRSSSVWAVTIAYTGFFLTFMYIVDVIPCYFFEGIFGYSMAEDATYLEACNKLLGVSMLIGSGALFDTFLTSFNVSHLTKMYYFISSFMSSLCLVVMTLAGCRVMTALIFYVFAVVFMSISLNQHLRACLSMSPNFVGTIVAFTQFVPPFFEKLRNLLISYLVVGNTIAEWRNFTLGHSVVCILAALVYVIFGNAQLVSWNTGSSESRDIIELDEQAPDGEEQSVSGSSRIGPDPSMLSISAIEASRANRPMSLISYRSLASDALKRRNSLIKNLNLNVDNESANQ